MFELKKCSRCKEQKEKSEFYKDKRAKDGLCSDCKRCHIDNAKEYQKKYSKTDKAKESRKIRNSSNKHKEYLKKWMLTEKGQLRKKRHLTENYKEYKKCWREKNKIKMREYFKKYIRERRKSDIEFNLSILLRERIRNALKKNKKNGSHIKDLGCTLGELKIYLENKFTNGMTWKNQGKWEIDHIYPLSKLNLKDRTDFLKACHYTNLQPMWKIDNIKKGNKIQ